MEKSNTISLKHRKALELDKILAILAQETSSEDAAEAARALEPNTKIETVQKYMQETDEAFVLMARFGAPSFCGLTNVNNALKRAEAGGILNLTEILRISRVLNTLREITEWRAKSKGVKSTLDWRFEALSPNKYLERRIAEVVLSEEEISDTASPTLHQIRRKIYTVSLRIREQMNKMVHSSIYQKYLQETIITIRSGRFVLPVKAEFRGQVSGLVHDTSTSGSTIFVEPLEIVEANNEIRVLQSQETAEIEKILFELSGEIGSFAATILTAYQMAVDLDLIFAKAQLAYKMNSSRPSINNKGILSLKKARHPLIPKERVVATDIDLGQNFDSLIITGPNTGGKTVSIKMIGLFTLMAMCGLMLPVGEGSIISLFEQVLVDIGDEQSIEQSLSTFSAHMINIIEILKIADSKSLVLLDELGSGTDPIEGAALATSILESLREKHCKIAATTHYVELKAYALKTEGVENACCEFDVATLRPTYRLLIGIPGRSNAFAILKRLGMADKIVERAQTLVSNESIRFEEVVDKLEKTRQALEKEKTIAKYVTTEAIKANQEAQAIQKKLKEEKEKELDKARQEAALLVSKTRLQMDALLSEMEKIRRDKNKEMSVEQRSKLNSAWRKFENQANPVEKKEPENYILPRPLKVGDTVIIVDINKQANVLDEVDDKGNILVRTGIIQTRVPVENLRLTTKPKEKEVQKGITRNIKSKITSSSISKIDLRGRNAEEALYELDRYIDSSVLMGINQISIIHGKGTGILRTEVQQYLKKHPSVRTYRLGTYGQGDTGITIAELK